MHPLRVAEARSEMNTRRGGRWPGLCPSHCFPRAVVLAGLLLLVAGTDAQTIYRCGPGGRSYSQVPCENGTVLDVQDPRTPQQQGEAQAQRARLVREAQALPPRKPEIAPGAVIVQTRSLPPEPVLMTGPQTYKKKVRTRSWGGKDRRRKGG